MKEQRFPQEAIASPEGFLEKHRTLIVSVSERMDTLMQREMADPREFADLYRPEDIEAEMEKVRRIQADFAKADLRERLAFAAEGLIYQQIGISGWLSAEGVKVYVEKSAAPDDVLRGTDMVLEFDMGEGREPLAVTVDLTISQIELTRKIHKIKKEIDDNVLADVKYHTNPDGEHKALPKTPRVAVSVSPQTAVDLSKLWNDKSNQALKEHPIQLALTRQMHLQLEAYERYARENGKTEAADKYRRAGAIIAKVAAEKESRFKNAPERVANDSVEAIKTALTSQLRTFVPRELTPQEESQRQQKERLLRKYR